MVGADANLTDNFGDVVELSTSIDSEFFYSVHFRRNIYKIGYKNLAYANI